MKKVLTLFLCLAVVFSLAACGGAAPVKEELPSGSITWVCNDYKEMPQKMVDEYNATVNPNLEIKVEIYPRAQLMEVIEIKLGAGDSDIDMIFVDTPLTSAYTYRDYLAPLTSKFTKEELDGFADSDRAATTIDGEFMAAPLMSSTQALLVNKTLLAEAGVTFPEKFYDLNNRITWEELLAVAVEFQQKMDPGHTKGLWGFSFDQIENVYQILPLANSLGAKGIADDGYTVDGVLNTPEWEKAMQFYQDLYVKNGVSPNGLSLDEIRETFYSGKMAFFLANTIRAIDVSFDAGWALHPYFEGGKPATPMGSWALGINKNSKKQEMAVHFLKWCTSGPGAEFWMVQNNQLPARKNLLENMKSGVYPAYEKYPLAVSKVGISEALTGAAFPRPSSPGFLEFDTAMSEMFMDIRSGANVKQALEATTQRLQSSFAKYKP